MPFLMDLSYMDWMIKKNMHLLPLDIDLISEKQKKKKGKKKHTHIFYPFFMGLWYGFDDKNKLAIFC